MPSSGATRIPSVSTARPTRTARSMASSLVLDGAVAISFAMSREATSRLLWTESSLILSATPLTFHGSSSFSTREARSSALGISTKTSGSSPRARALLAVL